MNSKFTSMAEKYKHLIEQENKDTSPVSMAEKYKHLIEQENSTVDQPSLNDSNYPSSLESAIRGLGQGLSFGFADELTALGESALTPKTYNQALEESRQAYKAAEEANPGTYLAGELLSSVPASIIPGAGIAKLATALRKVKAISKLATTLPKVSKVAKMAVIGATEGALYGAGQAEQDKLSGALEGAKGGAIAGAVADTLGQAYQGAKKAIKGYENFPEAVYDAKKAYEMGLEGKGITGKQSLENIENRVEEAAKNASNLLNTEVGELGKIKDEILTKIPANKDQALKELYDTSNTLLKKPNLPEVNTMLGVVETYIKDLESNPNPSLSDIRKVAARIDSYVGQFYNKQSMVDLDAVKSFQQLGKNLKDLYRKSVDSDTAQKILKSNKQISPDLLSKYSKQLSEQFPVESIDNSLHKILNVTEEVGGAGQNILKGYNEQNQLEAIDKLSKFISGKERRSDTGASYRRLYKNYLKNLEQHDPQLAQKFKETIQPIAEEANVARLGTSGRVVGERGASDLLGRAGQLSLSGVNMAAQAARLPEEAFRLAPKSLQTLLVDLKNATPEKRQVIMNMILQNPEHRKYMSDMLKSKE